MKHRTFNIVLRDGARVPCTGYEFNAGDGITLVAHHVLIARPDWFGGWWTVSDPASGVQFDYSSPTRRHAIDVVRTAVARLGAAEVRARLAALQRANA